MGGEFGHCRHFGGVRELEGIYIETSSVTFAEEIYCLSVSADNRIAVLTATSGQVGVAACLGIVTPYVTCH